MIPTNQSKQELREQINNIMFNKMGNQGWNGSTSALVYVEAIDAIMSAIQSHDEARNQEARLDDRIARIMTQQYDQGWAAGWAQRAKEEDCPVPPTHPNEHGEE